MGARPRSGRGGSADDDAEVGRPLLSPVAAPAGTATSTAASTTASGGAGLGSAPTSAAAAAGNARVHWASRFVAHVTFVVTGLVLTLLNQYLADCGYNSPYAGFTAASKGMGFLLCALVWAPFRTRAALSAPPPPPSGEQRQQQQHRRQPRARCDATWRRLRRVAALGAPVAACDVADTAFATAGVVWAKSGLFVIAFSSLTVWVALLRKTCLRQTQKWSKWVAVCFITVAIAASGAEGVDTSATSGAHLLLLAGVGASLVAAFADASMYILIERALTGSAGTVSAAAPAAPAAAGEAVTTSVAELCQGGNVGADGRSDCHDDSVGDEEGGGGEDEDEEEAGDAADGHANTAEDQAGDDMRGRGESGGDGRDDGAGGPVTPFELTVFIGACSTAVAVVWMGVVWFGGFWADVVVPVPDCGWNVTSGGGAATTGMNGGNNRNDNNNSASFGTGADGRWAVGSGSDGGGGYAITSATPAAAEAPALVYLALWCGQGVVGNGLHYIAFFFLLRHDNSLTASVSKACQSALIFFLSSLFFCDRSPSQCLTWVKVAASVVVSASVVLYAYPVKRGCSC